MTVNSSGGLPGTGGGLLEGPRRPREASSAGRPRYGERAVAGRRDGQKGLVRHGRPVCSLKPDVRRSTVSGVTRRLRHIPSDAGRQKREHEVRVLWTKLQPNCYGDKSALAERRFSRGLAGFDSQVSQRRSTDMVQSTTFVRPSKSRGRIERTILPRSVPGDNCDWDLDEDLSQSPPSTEVANDCLDPAENSKPLLNGWWIPRWVTGSLGFVQHRESPEPCSLPIEPWRPILRALAAYLSGRSMRARAACPWPARGLRAESRRLWNDVFSKNRI